MTEAATAGPRQGPRFDVKRQPGFGGVTLFCLAMLYGPIEGRIAYAFKVRKTFPAKLHRLLLLRRDCLLYWPAAKRMNKMDARPQPGNPGLNPFLAFPPFITRKDKPVRGRRGIVRNFLIPLRQIQA